MYLFDASRDSLLLSKCAIITSYESVRKYFSKDKWVYGYDAETKANCAQKSEITAVKSDNDGFLDSENIVHHEFVPKFRWWTKKY